jgi:hypothetical protein
MVTLCNPNNVEIGIIDRDNIQDEFKITPTFNEVSKLSMKVYKNLGDTALPCYDKIKKRRQLFIDGFGYFTITEVKEADIGVNPYKDVEAYSCEFELSTINVPYIDGTFKFYDEVNQSDSLMHTIMPHIPKWTLDTASIPSTIKNKSRTFEDVDDNIYKFLMTSVEETYGCVFEFDAINRIITVFDKDNYVNKTSVLLDDETVESIGIHENVDEMKTALKVTGGNDLDISYANPLGGIIIYDFHYYKDPEWMSQELIDALTVWENKLSGYESTYSDLVESLITKNNELITIETNLTSSEQLLEGYKKQKSAIIAENGNLSEINAAIVTEQINHDGLLVQLTEKQAEISAVQGQCTAIQQDLSFSTNFTADQYAELTSYIDCGDYPDENITITTNMTDAEVIAQSVELYNQAKNQLSKISEPKYEFPIESKSFVFLKQFQPYTEQIETGCLIDVRLAEDDIASLILLSMDIDFINGSCSFTFGNRYRLSNGCALLDGITNKVVSSSKTVEKQKGNWNYVAKSDVVSEFQNFKNSALDLTKNAIISADGQSVEVRDDGIHIRRLVDGTLDPKEIIITNGTIAFSDDNFVTSKTALGTITFPDSSTAYGLIAEAIYGNLIAGNQLTISSPNGDFIIDKDGVRSTVFDTIENVDSKVSSAMVQTKNDITMTFINGKLSGQTQFTSKGMEVDADGTEGSGLNIYNGGIKVYAESKVDVSGETEPVFSVDEDGGVNVIGEISGGVQILNPIDDVLANSNFKLGSDYELGWSEELYNAADIYLTGLHLNSGGMFLGDKIATYSEMGDGQYETYTYRGNVIETNSSLGINAQSQNGSVSIRAKGGVSITAGDSSAEGQNELIISGYGAWINGKLFAPELVTIWSGSTPIIDYTNSPVQIQLTDLYANIYDYRGVYIGMPSMGTYIFCPIYSSNARWLRGLGAYSSYSGGANSVHYYILGAEIINNRTINLINCIDIPWVDGSWGTPVNRAISVIYGLR